MESIAQIQERIVGEFAELDDPLFQYQLLLDYACRLPGIPEGERAEELKVKGCQSQAWLDLSRDEQECFHMDADSDTLVVRGVLQLLALSFNGQRCAEVAEAPVDFLEQTGATATFDASRRSGIAAIVRTIREFAHSC